jgi:hypothetical protein
MYINEIKNRMQEISLPISDIISRNICCVILNRGHCNVYLVALGGLVVVCLPMVLRFAVSNPANNNGIFKGYKNP